MIHLYTGSGKGKTTAAYGLCLRMAGQGGRAAVITFLKCGDSGEDLALTKTGLIKVFSLESEHGFYKLMNKEEQECLRAEVKQEFDLAQRFVSQGTYDLLVLDEIIDAVNLGLVDENQLCELLFDAGSTEIVLTGRDPSDRIKFMADYHTDFIKVKHPFDSGSKARKGIEY